MGCHLAYSLFAVHLGVDKLGVVRHVGRLLDDHGSLPFELVKDGDLLLLIDRMLRLRDLDTVRITEVKGRVDEGVVLDGRVRELDRLGNDAADEAADFGRKTVGNCVIDARRNVSGFLVAGAPLFLTFIGSSLLWSIMIVGMVLLLILVWSAGAPPKRRRLVHAVRDRAFLPGPPGVWDSEWVNVPASAVSADDIVHWPYIKPGGGLDLGVGGISFVELLILYELWAGERLSLEKAPARASNFSVGCSIWSRH